MSGFMTTLISCENKLLEKPLGSDLDVDSIFSTQQKSFTAIAQAYASSLASGITVLDWDQNREYGLRSGTLSHLSGELTDLKFNWEDGWMIQRSGMTADDGSLPRSDDGFGFNYTAIRQDYQVIENIDKVVDMTQDEKNQVKAEMKTLIAYRYEEMFKRYGGVPIVTKILSLDDDFNIPRSSLQDVLDHIISLCDDAIAALPEGNYPSNFKGRVTKGVAMAIKTEALLYAARPLFNSATPYMDLGENNNLICFGNKDLSRWQSVIDAANEVITWSLANGYKIINTGSPFDDYGNAVAIPNNAEVLLAYKFQFPAGANGYYSPQSQSGGANGMSYYQLTQYCKADGTEQTWPGTADTPYSDYLQRINDMEPRYKESAAGAGLDAWNNPGSLYWSSTQLANASNWEGRGGTEACGRRVKFWYHAAATRNWFEFPIYRLAEFYLDLAEAYNELGDATNALANLNVIRQRAGLPDATNTDKDQLRKIIQREWAVEFYEEGHRLYDVKHWKLDDIGNGIIGGSKKNFIFTYANGDYGSTSADYRTYSVQEVYQGFWSPNQYLSPFPRTEINKGYLVQNPGY